MEDIAKMQLEWPKTSLFALVEEQRGRRTYVKRMFRILSAYAVIGSTHTGNVDIVPLL